MRTLIQVRSLPYCLCLWFAFALSLRCLCLVYFGIWVKDLFCFGFIGVLTFQVDYQGNVTLLTQGIYMTKCQIDVTHYPFDPQVRYSLTIQEWINIPWFSEMLFEICLLDNGNNKTQPFHWWEHFVATSLVLCSYKLCQKSTQRTIPPVSESVQWSNLRSEIWHPQYPMSVIQSNPICPYKVRTLADVQVCKYFHACFIW